MRETRIRFTGCRMPPPCPIRKNVRKYNMKSYKRLLAALFALSLLLSFSAAAFAVTYSENNVRPGLPDIQPSDTLTLPNNTIWASLTAKWGVRVIFLDWDDKKIDEKLVEE